MLLSIVVPVYKEEEVVPDFLEAIVPHLESLPTPLSRLSTHLAWKSPVSRHGAVKLDQVACELDACFAGGYWAPRKHQLKKTALVIILFSVIIILVRLPNLFRPVINWDESTFILMGQSILDGSLPYVELWDLKPPLAFYSFALFIIALGKSIAAIRVAGAICILIVAYFNYRIAETIWPQRGAGLIAGVLSIALVGANSGGQATMTELVALPPLMAALFVLGSLQLTLRNIAGAGALIAAATLIRLNLLYVSLAVAAAILMIDLWQRQNWKSLLSRQLVFGAGHAGVGLATLLPYLYAGELVTALRSVVLAPLSYSSSRASLMEAFVKQTSNVIHQMTGNYALLSSLSWMLALLAVFVIGLYWKRWSSLKRRAAGMLVVFSGAVALSILNSGGTHSHYLIQLVPFVSALAAVSLGTIMQPRKRAITLTIVLLTAIISAFLPLNYRHYQKLFSQLEGNDPYKNHDVYAIADYLNDSRSPGRPIYIMDTHIIYWFINAKPLTRCTTHPSNISKAYLFPYCSEHAGADATSNMAQVLSQKPEFIVKKRGRPKYLGPDEDGAWQLLSQTLMKNCTLAKIIGKHEIFHCGVPLDPVTL